MMRVPPNTDEFEAVLDIVRAAWRKTLPEQSADDHQTWADAGGDSLDLLKMAAQVETMLGRPLAYNVVDMGMTPTTLASRIVQTDHGGAR